MQISRIRLFTILALLMLLVAPARASSVPPLPAMVRIPGHVLPALAKATRVSESTEQSRETADKPIILTLVLKRDDQAGFERYLHDVYDPHSSRFHHFLKQSEIADRFGPSRADYDALLRYMRLHSFTLTQGSKNRLTLTVRGTRAAAERALDLNIGEYRLGQREFYANDKDPALPASLASHVQAIAGTSDFAKPHHAVAAIVLATGLICWAEIGLPGYANALCPVAECFSAFEAGAAAACPSCQIPVASAPSLLANCGKGFSAQPFRASQLSTESSSASSRASEAGAGQKIGLVEFDNFHSSDVSNYISLIGAPATEISNLSEVNVNGGVSPGSNEDEVLLDIDAELTLVPGAQTVVYDAPFAGAGSSFQPIFNQMISDGVSIISNSWAYCEDQTTQADADSIDSIFQQAAAAGISVFNGSGDDGSTCLDGAQNTIAVPSDSPNATAVGGTSLTVAPGDTYQSETWWDGQNATPPTGQGGFGVSKFFATPAYQTGLVSAGGRSVPDVVENADPSHGVVTCQADAGGCPTGLMYSGTSVAAPVWAAFAAQMNQQMGKNLGFLNPLLYPLANTGAFHDAASIGSDVSHVGLGSPNLDALELALSEQSAGAVSASASIVAPLAQESLLQSAFEQNTSSTYVPADGSSDAFVVVQLLDANGHLVSGKTVTLGSDSANAKISPSSVVTSSANGTAQFTVTDSTAENVTFTATDSSDGIMLTQQPMVLYGVPPAASGEIVASLNAEPADGSTTDTITVTLKDSLGRPTPGKVVTLDQGSASSVITGPSPAITDGSGEIRFSVTDLQTENVTYTGTDVTDGDLAVPGSAMVDFTNGGGGCASASYVVGTANPAPGYVVSAFATGFFVSAGDQGFSYNCFGAYGMAWDAKGNMYVTDWPTGKVYKFGTSGGVADAGSLFTTVQAPATGLAIDPAGNMFASEGSVSGANGDIVPVDLSNGTVGTAIASGIPCLGNMAIDPAIPALYVNDFCSTGPVSPDIWQVTGIDGASPATVVYAQTPDNIENLNLAVAPDGAVYDVYAASAGAPIARVAPGGTSVTTLTAADDSPITLTGGLGMTVGGKQASGDAQFVIAPFNPQANSQSSPDEAVRSVDLTGASPAPGVSLTTTDFSGLSNFAIGPDGCLYVAGGPTVSRVTNSDGSCSFGPSTQPPTIALTPTAVTPNPAQGTSQSFTATLHYTSTLSGVPVVLTTTGANPQTLLANTNSGGQANFSYVGMHSGLDNVMASAIVSSTPASSNIAQVTWTSGTDATFLTLNQSPTSGVVNQAVTLSANLTDVSQNPAVALSGQQVNFSLGGSNCEGTTNASGNATCQVTPNTAGTFALGANFAGTSQYNASSASSSFSVLAPDIPPVPGKLRVSPKKLNFGSVELGDSKMKSVKITNLGKVVETKKKHIVPDPITIEMEDATTGSDPSPFSVTQCPPDDMLQPRDKKEPAGTCTVTVTFAPTTAGIFTGTLKIIDNVETTNPSTGSIQMVPMKGVGKAPKTK